MEKSDVFRCGASNNPNKYAALLQLPPTLAPKNKKNRKEKNVTGASLFAVFQNQHGTDEFFRQIPFYDYYICS